jgi:hypothetical protein
VLRDGRGAHFDPVLLDHFLEDLAQAGDHTDSHATATADTRHAGHPTTPAQP